MFVTEADGVRRNRSATNGWSRRSISLSSMIVTLAGLRVSLSGTREAVMTIWSVSTGNAGIGSLSIDELSRHRGISREGGRAHAPPAGAGRGNGRRTKAGSRLGRALKELPAFTVAGTAPDFHRLPFEPPPIRQTSVGGTLVGNVATLVAHGLSNPRPRGY